MADAAKDMQKKAGPEGGEGAPSTGDPNGPTSSLAACRKQVSRISRFTMSLKQRSRTSSAIYGNTKAPSSEPAHTTAACSLT